jgi:hypothetical protein
MGVNKHKVFGSDHLGEGIKRDITVLNFLALLSRVAGTACQTNDQQQNE